MKKQILKYEQDFINGKIVISSMEDWITFQEAIVSFCKYYNKKANDGTEQKITDSEEELYTKNFVTLAYHFINQVQKDYKNNLNEENLHLIVHQLQVLCTYHNLENFKEEIRLRSEVEKERKNETKVYQIKDIGEKSYEISKNYIDVFKTAVEKSYELYLEYEQVYTCIFGSIDDKFALLHHYEELVVRHKEYLIEGKIKIQTKNDWESFKKDVANLHTNYQQIINNITTVNRIKMGVSNDIEKYLAFIMNCITNIEKKCGNFTEIEEIPFIFNKIQVLCRYETNKTKIEHMYNLTQQHRKNENFQEVQVQTAAGNSVYIEKTFAEEYEKLSIEQRELLEKYNEAQEFIFRENEMENKKR